MGVPEAVGVAGDGFDDAVGALAAGVGHAGTGFSIYMGTGPVSGLYDIVHNRGSQSRRRSRVESHPVKARGPVAKYAACRSVGAAP